MKVTSHPALANFWLAHRIGEFQAKHPNIDVEIHTTLQVVDLRLGEFDLAIRFIEVPPEDCFSAKLFTDEQFPVCSPEYARKIGKLDTPADLTRSTLLRYSRIPWKPWFEAAGLDWPEPSVGPAFGDTTLLISAAANGAGIALAGRVVLQQDLRSGRLQRLFDIGVVPKRKHYAVCMPDKLERPEVALFLEWLLSEAREDAYKGAEEQLRRNHSRLELVIENLPAGAILLRGMQLSFNKAVEELTGYNQDEIQTLEQWFCKLYGSHGGRLLLAYHEGKLAGLATMPTEPIVRKDGAERSIEYSNFVHADDEVWLINDVSARREAEERVRRLAYHDHLTGLANRLMYSEQGQRALARARRAKRCVGVIFIDLDGFKQINDTLGHEAGDEVLKEVARRLSRCVRESDVAARFGGDEFALLLDDVAEKCFLHAAANRILTTLADPIVLGTKQTRVGASIGISVYPEDAEDLAALIRCADAAMYVAKAGGKNQYSLFSDIARRNASAAQTS